MKLLYVENHSIFAHGVTRQFLSDYDVTVAPSLSTARELSGSQAFDLVLVDYDLDDGKGDEFVRELRSAGNQIPVVGVSSHGEGNAALLKAGASAICSKMDFDNIQSVIETILPGMHHTKRLSQNAPVEGAGIERIIGTTKLRLVTGDIADQGTDAVVTAAHWRLNKGMGTDGTVHSKGGPAVYEECQKIGGCPIGDAVITTGGNLKAKHVIHAVGPVWHGGDEHEPDLLASAYRRSLQIAVEHKLKSISFPSISTGAFGYPLKLAAPVAIRAILEFLQTQKHGLQEVRVVLYNREQDAAFRIFSEALEEAIAQKSPKPSA